MIEVDGLCKDYPATRKTAAKRALRDVSFRCLPAQVYALLGPNGAGKTTALRIIATTLTASAGTVRVAGHSLAEPAAIRRSIGFLTGNTAPYGRLTAREVIAYFGRLNSVPEATLARRVAELSDRLRMAEFLDRRCDKLSIGQKQKVGIARTIVHDPPVLILDEPTAGLDVLAARAILELIESCRRDGRTVLFSTHVMTEAAKLADQVGVLLDGELVAEGAPAELIARCGAADLEQAFLRLVEARERSGTLPEASPARA
ncbi:MAG: ATP-binding cassette domain-containing protein [Planctomycetes bacterium]|nr:ATP-binding cassette domain-containing protein [Planctomycetota bacterium]